MNLLGARETGPCWKAFHLHPQKRMAASTAIFLFGWCGGVIAHIPPVPTVGGRSEMASGAYRSLSRERTSLKWRGLVNLARSCKLKNLALGACDAPCGCQHLAHDPEPTSRNAKILAANSAKMEVESQLADKAGAMLRH